MCDISYYVFFSRFNIRKDHICITVTSYFNRSKQRLYLF